MRDGRGVRLADGEDPLRLLRRIGDGRNEGVAGTETGAREGVAALRVSRISLRRLVGTGETAGRTTSFACSFAYSTFAADQPILPHFSFVTSLLSIAGASFEASSSSFASARSTFTPVSTASTFTPVPTADPSASSVKNSFAVAWSAIPSPRKWVLKRKKSYSCSAEGSGEVKVDSGVEMTR